MKRALLLLFALLLLLVPAVGTRLCAQQTFYANTFRAFDMDVGSNATCAHSNPTCINLYRQWRGHPQCNQCLGGSTSYHRR